MGRIAVPADSGVRTGDVRIVVIDDHAAVRAGLERLLERARGVVLVAALADGRRLMELAHHRRLDVVILDYDLERGDGLTLCLRVKQLVDPPAVLVYSGYAGPALATAAAVAQADAVVSKADPIDVLLVAIERLRDGDLLLPTPSHELRQAAAARLRNEDLAVMAMLIDGVSVANIADALSIDEPEAARRARRVIGLLQIGRRRDAAETPWSPQA